MPPTIANKSPERFWMGQPNNNSIVGVSPHFFRVCVGEKSED